MTTEVEQSKLNIHVLTQNQYEELPSVSNTELYIVDPQFQGQKFLGTDEEGEIVEKDALQGVQINGTDLTISDNKVNIPKATTSALGVVQPTPNWGIGIDSQGRLMTSAALDNEITGKSQSYKPLVPTKIDLIVKTGITTNTLTLTDSEKTTACDWIGASQETEIVDWIES